MQVFLHFMQQIAPGAEVLYILGDLFEYWAGDDDIDDPFNCQITDALHALSVCGTAVNIMHGNRDLLMGQKLAQACDASLLTDPTLLNLYGTPTLLTHGDLLCTDDIAYQDFRKQVHEPAWQQKFLAQPLAQRKAIIMQLRARSENEKKYKNKDIMDVNLDAVASMLRQYHYPRMIHGHTHRLKRHLHAVDGHSCERWVLGDWHDTGNALRCDAMGCSRETITF
ncbi:UDP-2,3-diacylglucosamine diphosphatase [Candidatus Nitrotoga sp. BS]|nr:UDP-2,3-diacylglucosamine diphosphatase [Candidatus Nitrotoga sp. BS]